MRPILSLLLLATLASTTLSGCLIRTRSNTRGGGGGSCPPAYHWDGYGNCVHNGNGRGGGSPPVRDHRH